MLCDYFINSFMMMMMTDYYYYYYYIINQFIQYDNSQKRLNLSKRNVIVMNPVRGFSVYSPPDVALYIRLV